MANPRISLRRRRVSKSFQACAREDRNEISPAQRKSEEEDHGASTSADLNERRFVLYLLLIDMVSSITNLYLVRTICQSWPDFNMFEDRTRGSKVMAIVTVSTIVTGLCGKVFLVEWKSRYPLLKGLPASTDGLRHGWFFSDTTHEAIKRVAYLSTIWLGVMTMTIYCMGAPDTLSSLCFSLYLCSIGTAPIGLTITRNEMTAFFGHNDTIESSSVASTNELTKSCSNKEYKREASEKQQHSLSTPSSRNTKLLQNCKPPSLIWLMQLPFVTACVLGWCGVIFIPTFYDPPGEWKGWPVPCFMGGLIGNVIGSGLALFGWIFFYIMFVYSTQTPRGQQHLPAFTFWIAQINETNKSIASFDCQNN